MNDEPSFKLIAAISTMAAGLVQLATGMFQFLAIDFDFEAVADPASLITLGGQAAETLRWGLLLEIFGFFLLLVPAALYLWYWLRPHHPKLVSLYTVCGLAHLFIGAAGAATRLGVLPKALQAYSQASGAEQEMLAVAFQMFTDVYFGGLIVTETILLSIWLLGIGLEAQRERRAFGLFTTIVGVGYLLNVGAIMFGIEQMAAPLQAIFILFPIWTFWLGIVIWRRAEQSDYVLEPAAAD